ncbi:MAG: sigma 54-interacting transcriptional regulator [Deltaproteobacteria bacterium]|nr:sigma 54-interacting transcriptional regulator [Deltaproteobacteria bacterium]
MKNGLTFDINDEALNALLLEMAQQRSIERLFSFIVVGLGEFSEVALARIWILRAGGGCSDCSMMAECHDHKNCLHLVASTGHSICDHNADWTRIDGSHKRFPLGSRKVGYIAASGRPVVVECIELDSRWIPYPEWAQREGIKGFAGQPMVFRGEVLGVVAIFTRTHLTSHILSILRAIADHAAAALANATAFEEIKRLKKKLEQENTYLRKELFEMVSFGGIVGKSELLQKVLNKVELVAPSNASVLVLGESGTGKELIAREIHHRSLRKERAMIKVNCASISRDLFASEFFGHTKGSFTGAYAHREGRFSAADGGTLFLDEIGEIPLELQSKLLRVLQEGEYERVGENITRKVDTRIIASTNRDLKQEVKAGRFREDLYFRLNVFPIEVPPLRSRKDDIGPLAEHFLKIYSRKMNHIEIKLTVEHLKQLHDYDWPGNIRELQNIIERAVITAVSGSLHFDLPQVTSPGSKPVIESGTAANSKPMVLSEMEMIRLQRENTLAALQQCQWKIYGQGGAAELLGIKPTTLTTRIKKMGLKRR